MKLLLISLCLLSLCLAQNEENNKPVIGILTLPIAYKMDGLSDSSTFIHSQYAKFLERAGAQVVPIHYNAPIEEIHYTLERINGVLWTGGALAFVNKDRSLSPFAQAGKIILDKVKEMNDNGIHFPLWGTCMGHQLLMMLESNRSDVLESCPSSHTNDDLIFKIKDISESKLFGSFPEELIEAAKNENLTPNFHHSGVDAVKFSEEFGLNETVTLLATSVDTNGKEYVANAEFKNYPIFTAQYHPEVTGFTFAYDNTNHSDKAQEFMFRISEMFISEAKKNNQSYESYEELVSNLVQMTGYIQLSSGGEFRDNYYFENALDLISE